MRHTFSWGLASAREGTHLCIPVYFKPDLIIRECPALNVLILKGDINTENDFVRVGYESCRSRSPRAWNPERENSDFTKFWKIKGTLDLRFLVLAEIESAETKLVFQNKIREKRENLQSSSHYSMRLRLVLIEMRSSSTRMTNSVGITTSRT